ncbi:ImmA/IrrE family metallo-endopeptidase [Gracilibacillus sp. HCP3S3_G5_1]|uniref:ImmA/IrrE family metallo-endopeptidase n=1 Tax=unclassified Gracilibacillus TaxID=2625209 RepID=UPI003F8AAD14
MDIKKVVGQLVKKFSTNDPFEIAERMNIVVRHVPLGKILGYHTRQCRVSIIHINETASIEQQIFTCCHELGHAILHPEVNTPFLKSSTYFSNDKIEQEANEFAVELLFSQEGGNSITIHEATEQYGIPEQLLVKKFYA